MKWTRYPVSAIMRKIRVGKGAPDKRALEKLSVDVAVYRHEFSIHANAMLALVVDFWPVFYLRVKEFCKANSKFVRYRALNSVLTLFRPFVEGLSGSRIDSNCTIGEGFLLKQSMGVAIASGVVIGSFCTIYSGGCIAHKANNKGEGAPRLGNHVRIMLGAKIIGSVQIGSNVDIGANAVVLTDVPDDCTAVGVPARIVMKKRII